MPDTSDQSRTAAQRIEIDAPPEAVWEAIATGEGVARWFGYEARIDGRPGGKYFVSWGPECEGAWKIETWEPPRRLVALDENIPDMPQRVEYLIEGEGGRSVLTLVHSGLSADAAWDEMYDSVSRGWEVFMRTMRHSVERHPGADRIVARAQRKVEGSRDEVWARLIGPEGLGVRRDESAGTFETAREPALAGETWVWNPPKDLAGTVGSLNDAVLWIALERSGEGVALDMSLSAYAVAEPPVRALERRWRAMLDELFPAANGG